MRFFCLSYFLVLVSFLKAQNDIIVNQHHQNVFAINSSYSNLLTTAEANLYYKKLWSGFADSPEFMQLTIAGPVKQKHFGLGLTISNQHIGIFSHLTSQVSFAYKLKLNTTHALSFGLQAGIKRLQINFANINARDEEEFEKLPQLQSSTLPTADFSVSYSNKHIVAFITANQLLGTRFNYKNPTYQNTLRFQIVPYYVVGLVWKKQLHTHFSNSATFVSRSHQGLTIQAELSDVVTWKEKISVGLGYRQTYNTYALARFAVTPNIAVGYSYEYNTHKLNANTKGGHEFCISYLFNATPKEKETQKKLSNKNISDIYEQIEQVTKTLNANKIKTDSLNATVEGLKVELAVLEAKQVNQDERNKRYNKNLIKTDSIDEALKDISFDIKALKAQQGNQKAVQQFIDSLRGTTLNAKPKRVNAKTTIKKNTPLKTKKHWFWNKTKKQKTQPARATPKPRTTSNVPKTKPQPLVVDKKPVEVIVNSKPIMCFVKDKEKLKLINAKLTLVDLDSRDVLEMTSKTKGVWQATLNADKKHKLICSAIGYKTLEKTVDINFDKDIELFLEPMKVGENFIMRSIYFQPNTYALKKESEEELKKLLDYLIENPTVSIEIQGHTNGDNRIYKNKEFKDLGDEWNFKGSSKKLSGYRATAIKEYLVTSGIMPERLVAKGLGGDKPIIENPETMAEGQKNIRVEVVILKN